MARFDVFELRDVQSVLALDVQADLFDDLRTTIIVPLRPLSLYKQSVNQRINPRLLVQGEDYVMFTTDLGVIPRQRLGRRVANVETDYRDTITAAIDFLLTGF